MEHILLNITSLFFPERAGETRGALHHRSESGHQNSEPGKALGVCAHEGTRRCVSFLCNVSVKSCDLPDSRGANYQVNCCLLTVVLL